MSAGRINISIIYTHARSTKLSGVLRFGGGSMQGLDMRLDDTALRRQLSNLEVVQLPYAGAMALNDTAYESLKHIQDRMAVVFDRPTRWTKNALMVWRATKQTMETTVKERPSVGSRHYLKVQEAGGSRPQTGIERLLAANVAWDGYLAAAVPAAGAKLDSYGNWSSGERNQVLSALGAQGDKRSNTTAASAKRARGRASYFAPKTGLPPGVYKRTVAGKVTKVLTFARSAPQYQAKLGFYDGVADVWVRSLPAHLDRRLAEAVAKAR